jgi:hypothetical protein
MRKLLFIILAALALTSCEDSAVANGRKLYEKHYREVLKDPESFKVYSEQYTKIDEYTVSWTLDYGAKNSFGGMVRETAKFKTCGSSIFFDE